MNADPMSSDNSPSTWPTTATTLAAEQRRLAAAKPAPWLPPDRPLRVAAAFVAFVRGEQGPGHPGDHAWVGAVLLEGPRIRAEVAEPRVAGASYAPGLLALREGPMLAATLDALSTGAQAVPDVLLVDATGRDHPRRAGLALHLGAALGIPSIGVTHRPLRARGSEPDAARGSTARLTLDGDDVARWVRTAPGVRPVVAHAAWRTDAEVAAAVVVRTALEYRTPEPLRQARRVARQARATAERRTP